MLQSMEAEGRSVIFEVFSKQKDYSLKQLLHTTFCAPCSLSQLFMGFAHPPHISCEEFFSSPFLSPISISMQTALFPRHHPNSSVIMSQLLQWVSQTSGCPGVLVLPTEGSRAMPECSQVLLGAGIISSSPSSIAGPQVMPYLAAEWCACGFTPAFIVSIFLWILPSASASWAICNCAGGCWS